MQEISRLCDWQSHCTGNRPQATIAPLWQDQLGLPNT